LGAFVRSARATYVGSARRNKIKASRNKIQARRNKIQAGHNEIQIGRKKIKIRNCYFSMA